MEVYRLKESTCGAFAPAKTIPGTLKCPTNMYPNYLIWNIRRIIRISGVINGYLYQTAVPVWSCTPTTPPGLCRRLFPMPQHSGESVWKWSEITFTSATDIIRRQRDRLLVRGQWGLEALLAYRHRVQVRDQWGRGVFLTCCHRVRVRWRWGRSVPPKYGRVVSAVYRGQRRMGVLGRAPFRVVSSL